METTLNKTMEELMGAPGVNGAMCVDKQGLIMTCAGRVPNQSGGYIASLMEDAKLLNPDPTSSFVLSLECSSETILLQEKDGISLAVVKSNSKTSSSPSSFGSPWVDFIACILVLPLCDCCLEMHIFTYHLWNLGKWKWICHLIACFIFLPWWEKWMKKNVLEVLLKYSPAFPEKPFVQQVSNAVMSFSVSSLPSSCYW